MKILVILCCVLIILILAFAVGYGVKYFLRGIEKLRSIKCQMNAIYYYVSKNNQMLSSLQNDLSVVQKAYCFDDSWSKNNPYICHALGEIDGILFTQCKEAFEKHYREGSRVFELDFSLTSDGEPVVIHDWDTFNHGNITRQSGRNKIYSDMVMSEEEFSKVRILGKYTPLTLERFVELANKYKDASFIVSVKSVNQCYDDSVRTIFGKLFDKCDAVEPSIRKRLILHAYSFEFLHRTMKEFQFESAVYRIMEPVHPMVLAEELKKCGLTTTTTTTNILYTRRDYCRILHENGIKVIGCVITGKHNARVKKWLESDVDMIMSPIGEITNG